ncbi:winged helix-turn-helix domain-containing protein [Novosphingobium jiangmenense]|uniref:Winged helix-turn-helix domain-containing protein n=1 Tax=Novosphingobium jiangmenense TaxID=2791981 RepID=A0ABS0HF50_9SPHN|nr:winged helix-turn-helix domain-containing protein [Novosphingobium jiangmenense]
MNDDARTDIVVRMALVGEASSSALLVWSELLHRDIAICRASENYLADISPQRFFYDVLIIAGNDTKRIKRLLRYYAPALALKPKIALARTSSPSERAALLRAGFDDVFDTRMPMPEAQARMRALVERYGLARLGHGASVERVASNDQERHFAQAPSGRERAVFELLLAAKGSAVPARSLARALGREEPLKPATIKVIVSALRKKLREGADIRSDRQSGYALSLPTEN